LEVKEKRTYQAVIGLEFHVHLATSTKMFCGCRVTYGDPPNTHTCPVCLGHPGALPVTNEKAVELGVMAGLALNCDVADRAIFARKNYFYPDLPKGYQISQFDEPICTGGHIDVPTPEGKIRVGITRLHLEEDAAKNVHVGTTGRMQLRCDANVSIRNPDGTFGTKTELKNMNSFRFVERGLARELERQREILENGGRVEQTTLHYDPETDEVHELRSKEYAHDYRYFPEPDLLPLELSRAYVREIEDRLPELPDHMIARFVEQYGLSEYDAGVLTSDRNLASFYEAVAAEVDPKQASNWISGDLRALLNETGTDISDSRVTPEHMKELIELVAAGTISRSAARTALEAVFETGDSPSAVVEREGLASVGSDELSEIVDGAISANPEEAERVKGGDKKVVGFLVGQVMKATRGSADGRRVRELLLEKLGS
jgi:aspartyl-tRNA(Asn)/glutamyl-tRNA(Gln) amidotransferase subunit B